MANQAFLNPINYSQALEFLKKGEVVALPTETVYGLAGRIDSEETLKKIFQIKKRPFFDPLIVHFADVDQIKDYIKEDLNIYRMFWEEFSPGPLTIVIKKNHKISDLITADKDTVAVRISTHPIMKKILKDLKIPLAAPSANIFNKVSPTSFEHVVDSFENQVPVLDGGRCEIGLESTIIKLDSKHKILEILRPGFFNETHFKLFLKKRHLNYKLEFKNTSSNPGGSSKHYSPDVPLIIVESDKDENEISDFLEQRFKKTIFKKLSLSSLSELASRSLYRDLRNLSQNKIGFIFVIKNSSSHFKPEWQAIWNRLEKASSETIVIK